MTETIITGAGGMLGSALVRCFRQRSRRFKAYTHKELDITCGSSIDRLIPKTATVINAAGINPHGAYSFDRMATVNSMGPHMLAAGCARLVQVSTDCVFSGEPHNTIYHEASRPSPKDWYGYSKLAGEVTYENNLTVRCSFVGLTGGLLKWLYTQPEGATIDGWANALWTGFHVDDLAYRLWHLSDTNVKGLSHQFADPWTKYELLLTVGAIVRKDVTVKHAVEPRIDRRLGGPEYQVNLSTRTVLLDSVRAEHERLQEAKS